MRIATLASILTLVAFFAIGCSGGRQSGPVETISTARDSYWAGCTSCDCATPAFAAQETGQVVVEDTPGWFRQRRFFRRPRFLESGPRLECQTCNQMQSVLYDGQCLDCNMARFGEQPVSPQWNSTTGIPAAPPVRPETSRRVPSQNHAQAPISARHPANSVPPKDDATSAQPLASAIHDRPAATGRDIDKGNLKLSKTTKLNSAPSQDQQQTQPALTSSRDMESPLPGKSTSDPSLDSKNTSPEGSAASEAISGSNNESPQPKQGNKSFIQMDPKFETFNLDDLFSGKELFRRKDPLGNSAELEGPETDQQQDNSDAAQKAPTVRESDQNPRKPIQPRGRADALSSNRAEADVIRDLQESRVSGKIVFDNSPPSDPNTIVLHATPTRNYQQLRKLAETDLSPSNLPSPETALVGRKPKPAAAIPTMQVKSRKRPQPEIRYNFEALPELSVLVEEINSQHSAVPISDDVFDPYSFPEPSRTTEPESESDHHTDYNIGTSNNTGSNFDTNMNRDGAAAGRHLAEPLLPSFDELDTGLPTPDLQGSPKFDRDKTKLDARELRPGERSSDSDRIVLRAVAENSAATEISPRADAQPSQARFKFIQPNFQRPIRSGDGD